jgi:hypothetical protein
LLGIFQTKGRIPFPFNYIVNGSFCSLGSARQVIQGGDSGKEFFLSLKFRGDGESSCGFVRVRYECNGYGFIPVDIVMKGGSGILKIEKKHRMYSAVFKVRRHDVDLVKLYEGFTNLLYNTLDKGSSEAKDYKKIIGTKFKKQSKEFETGIVTVRGRTIGALYIALRGHFAIGDFVGNFLSMLFNCSGAVSYVAPGRLYPDRIYIAKDDQIPMVDPAGENVAVLINKWRRDRSEKFTSLNKLGEKLGIFNEIKTKQLADGLIQVRVRTSAYSGWASLQDVGFGVSQVLPVLVAEVSSKKQLSIISQPELHLHPSAQADLVNLFANNLKTKQYIIETHSEYIIARLRESVAKGDISKDDVIIYHMTPKGQFFSPERITIDADGNLVGAPDDYFDTYRNSVFEILLSDDAGDDDETSEVCDG